MATSTGQALTSFFLTVSLLIFSLGALHQTDQYLKVLAPQSTRIDTLSIICPLLSIITYISPVFSIISIIRNNNPSTFPIGVVVAQASQNVASAAYGIQIVDAPFFISSAAGLVFQLIWITMWYSIKRRVASNPFWIWKKLSPVLASFGLSALFVISVHVLSNMSKDLVGVLCVAMTFLLCISPLASLGIVVRSRNSASIPFVMSFVMLLSNAAWTVYGVQLEDSYVILPSVFGFIITVFQILVSAWCNGVLFYDMTFLHLIYAGYQPIQCTIENPITEHKRSLTPFKDLESHESSD